MKFERYPFKRAQEMLRSGKIDAFTYYGRTTERAEYTRYQEGNILHYAKIGFIVLKSRGREMTYSGDIRELQGLRIITQAGFSYGSEFDQANDLKKYAAQTIKQLTGLLLNRRGDIGIVYFSDFYSTFKDTDIIDQFTVLDPPVLERPMYLGFSIASDTEKISQFFHEKFMEYKKTEAYRKLYTKYFGAEE